jgi:FixJ family two-component response regulator
MLALEHAARSALEERMARLTRRQRSVLNLVLEGMSNNDIAGRLSISTKTVENHRARMMRRMQVGSLAELLSTYYRIERASKPHLEFRRSAGPPLGSDSRRSVISS